MEKSKGINSNSHLPRRKIFAIPLKYFALVGINKNLALQPYPLDGKIFMGLLIYGLCVYSIIVHVIYDAHSFNEYTQSMFALNFMAAVCSCFLILLFNIEIMFEYISICGQLVHTTFKYSAPKSIFKRAIRLEHKLSKIIFFIVLKLTLVCAMLPFAVYSYFNYYTSDLGSAAFELAAPMWFPFNWHNPLGYFVAIGLQYVIVLYSEIVAVSIMALAVGSYLYIMASNKCMKCSLFSISKSTSPNHGNAHTDRTDLMEQFIEFVQFQSLVKHSIKTISNISEGILTTLFLWSLASMCGALLVIQIQLVQLHHSDDFRFFIKGIIDVSYAFGAMFLACELGQRIILAYYDCSDMIDQFKWYRFPAKIQRILPLIMNYTQQPVQLKCFGGTVCDRELFKYVIKTAFSYFTVLRKFFE